LEYTKKCIESVIAGGGDFEILLTDNASTDGSGQWMDELTSKDPRVHVVHNTTNRGFKEPQNDACARAKGKFFVCLNNDTEVPKDWLMLLEQPFIDFSETATISGPSGTCCEFKDSFPSWHGRIGNNVEYIEGSCLCIPTALAKKYTLFAPHFKFAYAEDADLSLRMRAMGKTIHQVPFRIMHHRGATSNGMPGMAEIQIANSAIMTERWANYHKFRRFDLPIVIRRDEALGDVLLTTPLIRALREQMPRSELFFETALPHVLKHNLKIKKREPWGRWDGSTGDQNLYQWARVINLNMSYENMLQTHIVDGYFKKALIVPVGSDYRHTENYYTEADIAFAETNLPGEQWVAVHPGPSTWQGKAWPEDRFRKLCVWLMDNKWRVVIVGHQGGPGYPSYHDLRGHTSLQQLAAVMARCKFAVCLDSFPLHVAESVGTPVIGLFGVTDPQFILTRKPSYSIMGVAPCSGQRHREIGKVQMPCDGACIASISLDQVKEKVYAITK